jgi:protoporphyrinogen oxidase
VYASTAPEGLEEAVGFQPFLNNKFGMHYMANEVDPFLDAVRDCVAQEASAEVQSQRAETLRACILELRNRNRWKRSAEDK